MKRGGGRKNETAQILGVGHAFLRADGFLHRLSPQIKRLGWKNAGKKSRKIKKGKVKIMWNCKYVKGCVCFVSGVLFGTAGIKLLSSRDAKKAYVHTAAAALRVKECVMDTVNKVRENAEDVLAEAKAVNEERAQKEAEEAETVDAAEAEETEE